MLYSNMQQTLELASEIAVKTGELLLNYFSLDGFKAKLKPDNTMVTEADLAADSLIQSSIRLNFPNDLIISEESSQQLEIIDRPTWVIDPLDGTSNFSMGLHTWGVSIARIVEQKPETAALYFPLLNELYTAQSGSGAFLNGNKIMTKGLQKNKANGFFTCCTRTQKFFDVTIPYKTRILGSAAYDFCCVARGASMVGFQAAAKIWDIAAGWLLIQEAGGVVEVFQPPDPFPLIPATNYNNRSFATIMAANKFLANEARKHLIPKKR